MKASELIFRLQKLVYDHGDLEVNVSSCWLEGNSPLRGAYATSIEDDGDYIIIELDD